MGSEGQAGCFCQASSSVAAICLWCRGCLQLSGGLHVSRDDISHLFCRSALCGLCALQVVDKVMEEGPNKSECQTWLPVAALLARE